MKWHELRWGFLIHRAPSCQLQQLSPDRIIWIVCCLICAAVYNVVIQLSLVFGMTHRVHQVRLRTEASFPDINLLCAGRTRSMAHIRVPAVAVKITVTT